MLNKSFVIYYYLLDNYLFLNIFYTLVIYVVLYIHKYILINNYNKI